MIPGTRALAQYSSPLRASFLALLLVAACQPDAEPRSEAGDASTPGRAAADSGAPHSARDSTAAVPLPGLIAVMAGLERDMARLSRGLWRADHDTIAAAARAVAGHPKVPPSEARQIGDILGPEMAAFKAVDTEVHDLAVRIEALAEEGNMEDIITAEAELRAGCAACHTRFRSRIREALR